MEMAHCVPFSIYILVSRWRSYSNVIVALASGNKTVMRGGGALDVDRRGVWGVWNIPKENGRFGGKFSQFRFKVVSFEAMFRLKNNFNLIIYC